MRLCGAYTVIPVVISLTVGRTEKLHLIANVVTSCLRIFVRNILFEVNCAPCERPMSARSGSSKTIHSLLRQAVLTATSEKQLLLR